MTNPLENLVVLIDSPALESLARKSYERCLAIANDLDIASYVESLQQRTEELLNTHIQNVRDGSLRVTERDADIITVLFGKVQESWEQFGKVQASFDSENSSLLQKSALYESLKISLKYAVLERAVSHLEGRSAGVHDDGRITLDVTVMIPRKVRLVEVVTRTDPSTNNVTYRWDWGV